MSEAGRLAQYENSAALHSAADELAGRLVALAKNLASRTEPRRLRYGPGRVGQLGRRLSPQGFVLDSTSPQLLLSDGRLWTYSRSDSSRFPSGRYYDARTDFIAYASCRTFPGGREFAFLGAELGGYTFGFADRDAPERQSPGLWAIHGAESLLRYVEPDEAFEAIAASITSRAT